MTDQAAGLMEFAVLKNRVPVVNRRIHPVLKNRMRGNQWQQPGYSKNRRGMVGSDGECLDDRNGI